MINEIGKTQFNELYKKLPRDLQDAIYAQETGENVEAICDRNKIPEIFSLMMDGILSVYLGILPLDDFLAKVGEMINDKPGAKQIFSEIDRFLIFPYKESIARIYQPKTNNETASPAPISNN